MVSLIDLFNPKILNVGLAIQNADWNWAHVKSPFARLYYVKEGTAQLKMNNHLHQLTPSKMYYVPAFAEHDNICNGHFVHYYVHIYEDPGQEVNFLDKWELPVEVKANSYELALFDRLHRINPDGALQNPNPDSYNNERRLHETIQGNEKLSFTSCIESRGIILQLLARFFEQASEKQTVIDERITKAMDYIRHNINEEISTQRLADIACVSKDHFIRLFKTETNTTPLQFVNNLKIEKAQLLLLTSKESIRNIATSLAFFDTSYFNRIFKKITGFTPLEYRRIQDIAR